MFPENGCIFEKTLVVSQSVPRECKSISLYTLRPENWRKGLKVCWVHMSRRIWLSPFWPSDTIPGHSWTFHHTLIYSISFQVHYSVPFTTPSTPATLSTHHIVSGIPVSPRNSSPHVPLLFVSPFYHMFHCFLYPVSICPSPFLASYSFILLAFFDLQTHYYF